MRACHDEVWGSVMALDVVWLHASLQAAPLVRQPSCNMRPWSQEFRLQKMKRSQKNSYRWGFNWYRLLSLSSPAVSLYYQCNRWIILPFTYYQGSQDMAYWHDWWNQLSGFQRQLILLMSMVDDFWSSLTEGQRTVTGILFCRHRFILFLCVFKFNGWHENSCTCLI